MDACWCWGNGSKGEKRQRLQPRCRPSCAYWGSGWDCVFERPKRADRPPSSGSFEPGPLGVRAGPKRHDRSTVALPPKPIIIPEICPGIGQPGGLSPGVQSEMVRVLMSQRGLIRIAQTQEGFVERISSKSSSAGVRSYGTAPCTVPVDIVDQGIRHEEVNCSARQKFVRYLRHLRVSLLPNVGPFHHADVEMNATGGILTARPFLPGLEPCNFAVSQSLPGMSALVEHRMH